MKLPCARWKASISSMEICPSPSVSLEAYDAREDSESERQKRGGRESGEERMKRRQGQEEGKQKAKQSTWYQ